MNFNLRKACKNCPFLKGVKFLTRERAEEISKVIYQEDGYFSCHKTLEYCSESQEPQQTENTEHCAGAMIVLEKMKSPNQYMRVAERLGMYNFDKLVDNGVVDNLEEFRQQHDK